MALTQEMADRGHALVTAIEKLAEAEPDPAVRLSSIFTALFQAATRIGLTPSMIVDFCVNTTGSFVMGVVRKQAEKMNEPLKEKEPS